MSEYAANPEQDAILEEVASNRHQVVSIEALAGTGKSTLLLRAAKGPLARSAIRYFVFNAGNAAEAGRKFPTNTAVSTPHAYAWASQHPLSPQTMREVYSKRLPSSIFTSLRAHIERSRDIASWLRTFIGSVDGNWFQAVSLLAETVNRFAISEDAVITPAHLPRQLSAIAARLRSPPDTPSLLEAARLTWERMCDPYADFPITHNIYLKLASLAQIAIPTDVIFLDEAQDANPAILGLLRPQIDAGTRLVLVGDGNQRIYGFNGAIDAMAAMAEAYPTLAVSMPLTGSYRFGSKIAGAANIMLAMLGSRTRLTGLGRDREVTDGRQAFDCALFRSNAGMLRAAIMSVERGVPVYIIGGGESLTKMLVALGRLYRGETVAHPEVSAFGRWDEIVEYSKQAGASSAGLPSLVKMVDEHRGRVSDIASRLTHGLAQTPAQARFTLGTAHRTKGMEWDRILLGDDFHSYWPAKGGVNLPDAEELRLQYVALSRGRSAVHGNGLFGAMQKFMEVSGDAGMAARISEITGRAAALQAIDRSQAAPQPA